MKGRSIRPSAASSGASRRTAARRSTYLYTSFDHDQLIGYYRAADVALVTPLRDGMNLVAKEYVAAQSGGNGVLVLSEFAGAARELTDAILVNPWDPDAISRAIEAAVTMPIEERRERLAKLVERVSSCDAQWWATAFLTLLARPGPATTSWRPVGFGRGRAAASH